MVKYTHHRHGVPSKNIQLLEMILAGQHLTVEKSRGYDRIPSWRNHRLKNAVINGYDGHWDVRIKLQLLSFFAGNGGCLRNAIVFMPFHDKVVVFGRLGKEVATTA